MQTDSHKRERRSLLLTPLLVILSIISSTMGAPTVSAHTASAFSPHITNVTGGIQVVSQRSNKCLDIANYGNSVLIQQWTCRYDSTGPVSNQSWDFIKVGTYLNFDVDMINKHGTLDCLFPTNMLDGDSTPIANLAINACPPGAPGKPQPQEIFWIIDNTNGHIWNYGATIHRGEFIALDVVCTGDSKSQYGMADGATLQLWHETTTNACGGANQLWSFFQ